MSAADPTPGEIMRRLDETVDRVERLVERQERRDAYVEENFVRRQVWHEARRADHAAVANVVQDIGGIQQQQETDKAWRRQLSLWMAGTAITSLLAIAGLVLTVVLALVG